MIIKTHNYSQRHARAGFASLLTVVSVGIALLLVLVSMYRSTVESQAGQKTNLLKNDYQQKEEAFLRALTSIIPNKAIICMQDDSADSNTKNNLYWDAIFIEALEQSNSSQAIDPDIADELGISDARNANTGNTDSYVNTERFLWWTRDTVSDIIEPIEHDGAWYERVTSGTNMTASSSFPPPLTCSASLKTNDRRFPIVSFDKHYGASATGWVQADVDEHPLYNRVLAPKLHFNYTNGSTLIAKHNWWAFELSLAAKDQSNTHLQTRKKKYLISLYEIPSQLPISASTYASFGAHADGTAWSNINLSGSIFAEKVKTEGSFSTDAISSRQGVELSSETVVNGNVTGGVAGSNPFASHAREISQSKGNVFPISSSSDGGRVSFIPINRGLDFYDRFTASGNSPNSSNAVSPTSWDYYSIGAKQCQMRLDVMDVVSSSDQTPIEIRFSYWADIPDDGLAGMMVTETFTKGDNWPEITDADGDTFPFHVDNSSSGRPCVTIHIEYLSNYLTSKNAGHFLINKSISVNMDHDGNGSIQPPPFPSAGGDMAVMLLGAKDLTHFTEGFSLVTNMRLIIADDVNITPTTAPAGVVVPSGELYYPPLSFFSPEKRYGDAGIALKIDVDGQLGSLAKGNSTPVNMIDLKSGLADEIIPSNITANLKTINHPSALPPINMMNWMVVIREIHPTYTPPADDE